METLKKSKKQRSIINTKWYNKNKIILPLISGFQLYDIRNSNSKVYNLVDDENNNIFDGVGNFDYDPNNNNIVFSGYEINSSDWSACELFIFDLNSGRIKKLVDDEYFDILFTFFNKWGNKVFFLQESHYSKYYYQLNMYDLETSSFSNISERVKITRVDKNQDLAYGTKLEVYPEKDFFEQTEYKDIILDMENNALKYYDAYNDPVIYIDGYKVPVNKGYLDKEDVFILLSPNRKKALYAKADQFIKLIFLSD